MIKHLPPIACFSFLVSIANIFLANDFHGGLGWAVASLFWAGRIEDFVYLSKLEETFK